MGEFLLAAGAPVAPLRVLLVEDDGASARRLVQVVSRSHPQVEIAVAPSLLRARELLDQCRFDWALVDLQLPDGSGLSLLTQLGREQPATLAVVVSSWGHTDTVVQAIRLGARGYLLKSADDEELERSLASLHRGGAPIDPMVASRILALLAASPELLRRAPDGAHSPAPVSSRELEVLQHVAAGLTNREIAQRLELSVYTVECHTRSIYRKLDVRSRTEAVVHAQAAGWI